MRTLATVVSLTLILAACGDDQSASDVSRRPTTAAPTTAAPVSSAPTTSAATTIPASTTTISPPITTMPAPVTTATLPTTSTTPPLATWTDAEAYPSGFGMGCCGGNSTGAASPALTVAPAPLADGTYAFDVVGWSPEEPTRLEVSVRALVPCADGVFGCSPLLDGTYGPDDVGFSDESRVIEVTLDGSVTVHLAGDEIDAPERQGLASVLRSTSGSRLAALMAALADAYETALATPLRDGTPVEDVVADLQANPRLGFTSAADEVTGQLYFSFGDAPPVLFQSVTVQGAPLERSGTSVLISRTITIEGGAISLELYAGFVS